MISGSGFSQKAGKLINDCFTHDHNCCEIGCRCCPCPRDLLDNFAIKKKVGLIDTFSNDTSYYYFPSNIKTGEASVKIEYCARYFNCLNFLKEIHSFYYRKDSVSCLNFNHESVYDSLGRLTAYCVNGWFDMNSLPWVIFISYVDNTDLVKMIKHTDHMSYGDHSFEDTYQTFIYNANGNIDEIDFYTGLGELTRSYKIVVCPEVYENSSD